MRRLVAHLIHAIAASLLLSACSRIPAPTLTTLVDPVRDDPFLTPLREPALDSIGGCSMEVYRLLGVPIRDHVWTIRPELAGDSVRVVTKTLSGVGGYKEPKHRPMSAFEERLGRAAFDSVSRLIDSAETWSLPEAAHTRQMDATSFILEFRQGCRDRRMHREGADSSDSRLVAVFSRLSQMAHGTHPH